jgi:hypothetical protein
LRDLVVQVDPSRNEFELDVNREAWMRIILMELKPEQIVIRVSVEGFRMVILGDPHR